VGGGHYRGKIDHGVELFDRHDQNRTAASLTDNAGKRGTRQLMQGVDEKIAGAGGCFCLEWEDRHAGIENGTNGSMPLHSNGKVPSPQHATGGSGLRPGRKNQT